jgi:hypothetical protein
MRSEIIREKHSGDKRTTVWRREDGAVGVNIDRWLPSFTGMRWQTVAHREFHEPTKCPENARHYYGPHTHECVFCGTPEPVAEDAVA